MTLRKIALTSTSREKSLRLLVVNYSFVNLYLIFRLIMYAIFSNDEILSNRRIFRRGNQWLLFELKYVFIYHILQILQENCIIVKLFGLLRLLAGALIQGLFSFGTDLGNKTGSSISVFLWRESWSRKSCRNLPCCDPDFF